MPLGKAFIRKKSLPYFFLGGRGGGGGGGGGGAGTRKEIVNSLKETCFFDEQLFNHSELQ